MPWSDTLRYWLPALGTAIPLIILPIAILSIPLAAAQEMDLSEAETSGWILAIYGLPGLLGLVLAIRYRQPLLLYRSPYGEPHAADSKQGLELCPRPQGRRTPLSLLHAADSPLALS